MAIELVDFRAAVTTDNGVSEYFTSFSTGLNVLRARNSWGKSTLLHGMIFALGLEGAFTASHGIHLTPALTEALDLPHGRRAVIESFTAVTLKNSSGDYLRARRFARSLDFDHKLVQVWTADSQAGLETSEFTEYFVRHPGSAKRQRGFHHQLAEFLGCELPDVPSFGGGDSTLYLELLVPLFFVEQKFGWSGIAPRVRSNLRVKEPLKRGVEYLLGLSTLDRIKKRNALHDEAAEIRNSWVRQVNALQVLAATDHQRISFLFDEPVGPSKLRRPMVEVFVDGEWKHSDIAVERWRNLLKTETSVVPTVESRTESSRAELENSEQQAIRLGVELRRNRDQRVLLVADQAALQNRLSAIETDRRHLADAKLVASFGGLAQVSLLAENRCPTCEQDVDEQHTAFGMALSLDQNIEFLKAESEVVTSMIASAFARMESLDATITAIQSELGHARQAIRLLRDELVSPSSMPSVVQIQERLILQERVRHLEHTLVATEDTFLELQSLSSQFETVRAQLSALKGGDLDEFDKRILADFETVFQRQLRLYGLRSVSPSEVTISEESLLPDNGGFDLTFTSADMDAKVSASDTIRTKWAYVTALYEVASRTKGARHPGLLILDEPRQQEVDRNDVMAFIRRLAESAGAGQIIYVTSEDRSVVESALVGKEVNFLVSEGEHLFSR